MKTLLPILIFLGSLVSANAATYDFSYASPEADLGLLGYEMPDHYDVAIYIPATGITDAKGKLTAVSAIVLDNAQITGFKMWASATLFDPGEGVAVTGDVFNAEPKVEAIEGTAYKRITCTLDEPYTVDDKGLYVGYSFDVNKLDGTSQTKYPIVVTEEANGEAAMIARAAKNSHSLLYMDDLSLCCTATFEGDFRENAARVTVEPVFAAKGKPFTISGTVIQQGINDISSLEYTYTIGETERTGSFVASLKGRPGMYQTFSIEADAIDATGEYDGKFTITKVNGVDNQSVSTYTIFKANVLESLVTHRAVMEEFTGTWCQWCTRGMAGIEKIKDEIPNAIVIAYHQRDIMALDDDVVPECPQGLPCATIDRSLTVDPFFGSDLANPVPGAVVNDVRAQTEVTAPADIDVTAEWIDDDTAIRITSYTTFPVIPEDGYNYRIAYVLLEDGLHGQGADWMQKNGYSNYQGSEDPYLSKYFYAPSPIVDIQYNDVAIFSSGIRGINGSLPKTNVLEAGNTYEHAYEVSLDKLLTKDGAQSYQSVCAFKAVALLIKQDTANGTIANANITVVPVPAALDAVESSEQPVAVEYFDLTGRKVANPTAGIYVQRAVYANGQTSARKLMVR